MEGSGWEELKLGLMCSSILPFPSTISVVTTKDRQIDLSAVL